MAADRTHRIVLEKEDFKFSAAHFTLFGENEAEVLHGHNYRVRVEVSGPSLNELGFLVELAPLKGAIRRICARLDDQTLIPEHSPHLRLREGDKGLEIDFASRSYRIPRQDVLLLPLVNTTVELLASWIWQELARDLGESEVELLAVSVEETAGQLCRFEAPLADSE